MGVKDLWQLLAPVGRRVSIETLEGKVLAIDMSIWLTQFIKAMRDDEGKMMKNAHIIGTLRRILKLLYHRVRPVFVFDGATPALKLRVIQQRRKTHDKSEQNRKNAIHRLLLAQLKQQITQQAKEDTKQSPDTQNFAAVFKPASSSKFSSSSSNVAESNVNTAVTINTSALQSTTRNEMTLASIMQDDNIESIEWTDGDELPKRKNLEEGNENSDDDELMWTLPDDNDKLDVDVLTSLPLHIRKRIIEDAKRRERMRSRSTFMPVADNPILYSQTQLANFLQASKLNRRFDEVHNKLDSEINKEGKKIAAENKKYQFISREDFDKTNHSSSSALNNGNSSSNSVTKHRLTHKDDGNNNHEEDEEIEFTENDWARSVYVKPSTREKKRGKKVLIFGDEDENEKDYDNDNASTAVQNHKNTNVSVANVSKEISTRKASIRNRFFDDLEEEASTDEVAPSELLKTCGTEESHRRNVDESAPKRVKWSANTVFSIAHPAEEKVEDPPMYMESTFDLREELDLSRDDSEDDAYGAGGGFFEEEEGDSLTHSNHSSHDNAGNNTISHDNMIDQAEIMWESEEAVPTSNKTNDTIHDNTVDTKDATISSKPPQLVSSPKSKEQVEAEDFQRMMWEDTEEEVDMDNIAWESDHDSKGDDNESASEEENKEEDYVGIDNELKEKLSAEAIVINLVETYDIKSSSAVSLMDNTNNNNNGDIVDISKDHKETILKQPIDTLDEDLPYHIMDVDDEDDYDLTGYGSKRTLHTTQSSSQTQSEAALTRAISTASNMADWAGRAVRRVLKEHINQQQQQAQTQAQAPVISVSQISSNINTNSSSNSNSISSNAMSNNMSSSSRINTFPPPSASVMQIDIPSAADDSATKVADPPNDDNSNKDADENDHSSNIVRSYTTQTNSNSNSNSDNHTVQTTSENASMLFDNAYDNYVYGGFENEQQDLDSLKKSLATSARDAERITEEMKTEVLKLIQAFDLPFVIAPFEAEAQCAILEELGVVDGVITEDSDSFLFGAKSVYKNIFNDRKFVEVYLADDIEREMGLSRDDLIALAFFLGSDYTEGVHGVGIVNAMEIIQAFPMKAEAGGPVEGLKKFKQWLEGYDFAKDILETLEEKKKNATKPIHSTDSTKDNNNKIKKKKAEKAPKVFALDEVEAFSDSSNSSSDDDDKDDERRKENDGNKSDNSVPIVRLNEPEQRMVDFEKKHKTGRSKWTIPANFPDETVSKAYFYPNTNRNPEPFPFIPPSRSKVRKFISHILGWPETQMDAQVDPVLERFADRRAIQTRMDSFYTMTYQDDTRFAKIASGRLRDAVVKITGKSAKHLVKDYSVSNNNGTNVGDSSHSQQDTQISPEKKKRARASSTPAITNGSSGSITEIVDATSETTAVISSNGPGKKRARKSSQEAAAHEP